MEAQALRPYHGLAPELRGSLLALDDDALEVPALTYSDYRLIDDISELSGDRSPEAQALALALLVARDEGSLCVRVDRESLAQRLELVLEADAAAHWAARVVDWIGGVPKGSFLMREAPDTSAPLIRAADGPVLRVFFQAAYLAKERLQDQLSSRLAAPADPLPQEDIRAAVREVLRERPQMLNGKPFKLSPRQVAGVVTPLVRSMAVISGGPGTGKTTIVGALLRCLVRLGIGPDHIHLAAPSGRAAQRMTEAVQAALDSVRDPTDDDLALRGITGGTLHRLLGYNPRTGRFWRHADAPLPGRVVMVDEVSMVDAELMSCLLDALLPGARLVLLGDRDQLPSVSSGAVLADLIPQGLDTRQGDELQEMVRLCWEDASVDGPAGADPALPVRDEVVVLDVNHRSQREIREFAARIQRASGEPSDSPEALVAALPTLSADTTEGGELDRLLSEGREGCWRIEADDLDAAAWKRVQALWLEHWLPSAHYGDLVLQSAERELGPEVTDVAAVAVALGLLEAVGSARILTLLRHGPYGATGVNRHCARLILADGASPSRALRPGTPILITRNDSGLGLWNGDVGVVVRDRNGSDMALFRKPSGIRGIAVRDLPEHTEAYGMTVHKAQGSEYDRVLLVVPPEGGRRLLSREMVYTALTRARRQVLVYAPRAPLAHALSHPIHRDTGIDLFG